MISALDARANWPAIMRFAKLRISANSFVLSSWIDSRTIQRSTVVKNSDANG